LDLVLRPALIHEAAKELWGQVTATTSPDCTHPRQREWVFGAGCLASEIENHIDTVLSRSESGFEGRGRSQEVEQSSRDAKVLMANIQWVAHLHLRWTSPGGASAAPPSHEDGRLSASSGRQGVDLSAIAEDVLPSVTGAQQGVGSAVGGVGSEDIPGCSGERSPVAPANGDDATTSFEGDSDPDDPDDSSSIGSESSDLSQLEPGDHGTDLEDFIDFSEEHNCYGLLERKTGPSSSSRAATEQPVYFSELKPAAKEYLSLQMKPDWSNHCKRLLRQYPPEHFGVDLDRPSPKRLRR
jgi:hypothetical protein